LCSTRSPLTQAFPWKPPAKDWSPRDQTTRSRARTKQVPSTLAPCVVATVHLSLILRAHDEETTHAEMQRFVEDLARWRTASITLTSAALASRI
jgi:hypothetical protein